MSFQNVRGGKGVYDVFTFEKSRGGKSCIQKMRLGGLIEFPKCKGGGKGVYDVFTFEKSRGGKSCIQKMRLGGLIEFPKCKGGQRCI